MNNYTAFNANLNSVQSRLDARRKAPTWTCDLCGGRAEHSAHRIEGRNVLTAMLCGTCKKEWEEGK